MFLCLFFYLFYLYNLLSQLSSWTLVDSLRSQTVWTLVHSRPCLASNSHVISPDSPALSNSLKSLQLSFLFDLELSCAIADFYAFLNSLNSLQVSPSFGPNSHAFSLALIRSQRVWTLVNTHPRLASNSYALSLTLMRTRSNSLNSRQISPSFGLRLSCNLADSHALSNSLNSEWQNEMMWTAGIQMKWICDHRSESQFKQLRK